MCKHKYLCLNNFYIMYLRRTNIYIRQAFSTKNDIYSKNLKVHYTKQINKNNSLSTYQLISKIMSSPSISEVPQSQDFSGVVNDDEQTVSPWEAKTSGKAFNYQRLTDQFGLKVISDEMIARFEKLTGKKAHHLLRRGVFFSHQDFDLVLNHVEKGGKIYLYTGRGPSSESLHLGHMIPFIFTKFLQDAFGAVLVVQMSDDEKAFFKENLTFEEARRLAYENGKDIIACGFDINKTFIFSNHEYAGDMWDLVTALLKKLSVHENFKIYGFKEQDSVGKLIWPAFEMAPAMSSCFKFIFGNDKNIMCLVPCAVDQTPYFRHVRELCPGFGFPKPSLIAAKFLVGLQGPTEKMSATGEVKPIFMSDSPEEIAEKITKYAFSGGGATMKEHREKGANLAIDVPYIYLLHFLEDDAELERIGNEYRAGRMTTQEIKKILIGLLTTMVLEHQKNRLQITDETLKTFFSKRKLDV